MFYLQRLISGSVILALMLFSGGFALAATDKKLGADTIIFSEPLPTPSTEDDEFNEGFGDEYNKLYVGEDKNNEIKDPLEKMNRVILKFNTKLDDYVIWPMSKAYKKIAPVSVRKRISNLVYNFFTEPYNFINSLLQFNGEDSFISFWRFTLNSTFGIFGLFDVSSEFGIEKAEHNFGQTLFYYHVPAGPFVIVPVANIPTTMRGMAGFGLQIALNPYSVGLEEDSIILQKPLFNVGRVVLDGLSKRIDYDGIIRDFRYNSIDYYLAYRDAAIKKMQFDNKRFQDSRNNSRYANYEREKEVWRKDNCCYSVWEDTITTLGSVAVEKKGE